MTKDSQFCHQYYICEYLYLIQSIYHTTWVYSPATLFFFHKNSRRWLVIIGKTESDWVIFRGKNCDKRENSISGFSAELLPVLKSPKESLSPELRKWWKFNFKLIWLHHEFRHISRLNFPNLLFWILFNYVWWSS